MNTIITHLLKKEPRFPVQYEYLFEKYARKGGGSENERLERGQVFRNYYELYIYAFFVGFKNNQFIPLKNRAEIISKTKVSNIDSWRPIKLRNYLVSCTLTEYNIPLRKYDEMEESKLKDTSIKLRSIIEEYVYGGLSIIEYKYNDDKQYFDDLFAFTEFIFEEEINTI